MYSLIVCKESTEHYEACVGQCHHQNLKLQGQHIIAVHISRGVSQLFYLSFNTHNAPDLEEFFFSFE